MRLDILKQNGNIKVNLEFKKWLIKLLATTGLLPGDFCWNGATKKGPFRYST